jgi:hypothetical protein
MFAWSWCNQQLIVRHSIIGYLECLQLNLVSSAFRRKCVVVAPRRHSADPALAGVVRRAVVAERNSPSEKNGTNFKKRNRILNLVMN